jgi:CDP-glycerol glycerophosphotransferase (TagB/SpsB family)
MGWKHMKHLIDGIKYWSQLLVLPLYWLSYLVPRDKKKWLFGSTLGRRFSDNPRYLFLYCNQHAKELGVRPIWLSHDREIADYLSEQGLEAYYYHSPKGIWYALRGGVYFYDHYSKDINFAQSGGATKICMWHGIPLKKINADNMMDRFRHPKNMWENIKCQPRNISSEKPSDHVMATSEYMKPIFQSAFRNPENVFVCGYPRNDYLISHEIVNVLMPREKDELDKVEEFKRCYPDGKIIYYMPTYRESQKRFFDIMDMQSFTTFLRERQLLFCIKQHPFSTHKKEFAALSGDNVIILDADSDPFVLLKYTDILVTDYSSVYFDFLLADKPIIFFDYDLDEYKKNSRDLYFDYDETTPGEKATTMEEFMKSIEGACDTTSETQLHFQTQRMQLRNLVFDKPEQLASPRLVDKAMEFTKRGVRVGKEN